MSEALGATAPAAASMDCRVILVASPKGGVGKTTISRNILVRAAQIGLGVAGIDFDPQQSLYKWSLRRQKACEKFPQFVPLEVEAHGLGNWRGALRRFGDRRLIVIDTPPSIEASLTAIQGLVEAAHLVVVPTSYTDDDLDSVMPFVREVTGRGVRATFCLNKANPRTLAFQRARGQLLKVGPLVPIEIPQFEDVHAHTRQGLAVLDIARAKGTEVFESVYDHCAREAGLVTAA